MQEIISSSPIALIACLLYYHYSIINEPVESIHQILWGFILFHFVKTCPGASEIINYTRITPLSLVKKIPIEATTLENHIISACNKEFDENSDYEEELVKHEYGHYYLEFHSLPSLSS